jgi:hypothetical protein
MGEALVYDREPFAELFDGWVTLPPTRSGASLERLQQIAGPGLVICDAACGHPKTLAQIACSGLDYIVPLRASTGFRERYLQEVGRGALRPLGYVAERQRELPKALRTRYRHRVECTVRC